MKDLLRQADQILETAVMSRSEEAQDCTICISRNGAIRILAESAGWSFSGLAAEFDAAQLFRVERRGGTVRVEGWSQQQSCTLRREISTPRRSPLQALPFHAVLAIPVFSGVSKNELVPQVLNS